MTATDDAREVLARHRSGCDYPGGRQTCGICRETWPCPAIRLARTLLALAEPDEQIIEAAARALSETFGWPIWDEIPTAAQISFRRRAGAALTAALGAAEQAGGTG